MRRDNVQCRALISKIISHIFAQSCIKLKRQFLRNQYQWKIFSKFQLQKKLIIYVLKKNKNKKKQQFLKLNYLLANMSPQIASKNQKIEISNCFCWKKITD